MSEPEKPPVDPALTALVEEIQPKLAELTKNPDYAVMLVLAKRNDAGVQTFTNISGLNGVLMDALFSELSSQVEAGNFGFFALLMETLLDVEEEFALNMIPDDGTDDDSTLH